MRCGRWAGCLGLAREWREQGKKAQLVEVLWGCSWKREGKGSRTLLLGNGGRLRFEGCWDRGLLGMCLGEKRRLKIPADLGYGKRGAPPKIPGGATLIFDAELVSINGKTVDEQ
ncbi:uncharacterized protein A4U43_C08F13230 [Asparagus officinalis]|nr:uncharacterized protein A4U43_C08F13230 [Asparagus officinalis]